MAVHGGICMDILVRACQCPGIKGVLRSHFQSDYPKQIPLASSCVITCHDVRSFLPTTSKPPKNDPSNHFGIWPCLDTVDGSEIRRENHLTSMKPCK